MPVLLLSLLLPSIALPPAARAESDRVQSAESAQEPAAFCDAGREYFLSASLNTLSDRANSLPAEQRVAGFPPILLQQLQLIGQYQSEESRLYALQSVISHLYELTAAAANDADRTAALEPVLTQAAALVNAARAEHSATQVSLLTQLAQHHLTLQQPDRANQRLAQAQQAIATVQGRTQQASAWLQVAERYAQAGETEQAIAALDQSLTAAEQIAPSPDSGSSKDELLGGIARQLAQLGEFERAIALAQSMQDLSLQGFAQMEIVEALRQDQPDRAMQIAREMRNLDQRAVALSALAADYAQRGDDAQAAATFRAALSAAEQVEPLGIGTYGGYVPGYVLGRYGEWQPAAALALARSQPRPSDRVLAMIAIALTYQQQGETETANAVIAEAIATFQRVDASQQMNISSFVTYRLAEEQQYDWLFQLAAALPEDGIGNLRESVLEQAIFAALNQNQLEVAMRGIGELLANASNRSRWMNETIAALLKADQLDRAAQWVEEQLAASLPADRVRLLGTIAQHHQQAGRTAEAAALLQQAEQVVSTVIDPHHKAATLVELAVAYTRLDQPDRAAQPFAQALEMGRSGQGFASPQPLVSVGQYDWAFQLAQTIPTGELMTPEPINVVSAMLSAGAVDPAAALIPATEIPEVKTQLFLLLADYLIANRQPDRAAAVLEQAIAAARTISGNEARTTMVMGAGAYDYNDPTDRASQLEAIALRYVHLGQLQRATATLGLIESAEIRETANRRLRCEGRS